MRLLQGSASRLYGLSSNSPAVLPSSPPTSRRHLRKGDGQLASQHARHRPGLFRAADLDCGGEARLHTRATSRTRRASALQLAALSRPRGRDGPGRYPSAFHSPSLPSPRLPSPTLPYSQLPSAPLPSIPLHSTPFLSSIHSLAPPRLLPTPLSISHNPRVYAGGKGTGESTA